MYGLPDSWAGWAAKRGGKGLYRGLNNLNYKGKPTFSLKDAGKTTGGTRITLELKRVRIYHHKLRMELNTPRGELWRELEGMARLAHKGAKSQVGVKTGALQRSIYKRHLGNLTGQYIVIGSDKRYALAHHEGTRPHVITASPGGKLKFTKNGKQIFTKQVNHPGTKPNPYLTSQLKYFKRPIVIH